MVDTLAYDMPDDWKWLPGSTRFPLADMGELAARLNGLSTYDRRGEVIFQDDMAAGIANYYLQELGTGSKVRASCDFAYKSGFSLEIVSGNGASPKTAVIKKFSNAILGRVGIEIKVLFDPTYNYFEFGFIHYDGINLIACEVKVDYTNKQLSLYEYPNVYQVLLSGAEFIDTSQMFNNLKIVGDVTTGYYVRLLWNEFEYDITTHRMKSIASATDPHNFVFVQNAGTLTTSYNIYLGEIIITCNEQ